MKRGDVDGEGVLNLRTLHKTEKHNSWQSADAVMLNKDSVDGCVCVLVGAVVFKLFLQGTSFADRK